MAATPDNVTRRHRVCCALLVAASLLWMWLRSFAVFRTLPGTSVAGTGTGTITARSTITEGPESLRMRGKVSEESNDVSDSNATDGGDNDYDYSYILDCDDETEHDAGPTLSQMKCSHGCYTLSTEGRRLYTEEDWARLRRLYRDQGGGTPKLPKIDAAVPGGFAPPIRSGQTVDGKGRGAFATRDIRRGERTYGGIEHYAFFWDGPSYRTFVEALSDDEACDIIMWTWTQGVQVQGTADDDTIDHVPLILVVLDDNALQNGGSEESANTGCPPDHDDCGQFDEFALQDIKEGEEMLCDYNAFVDDFWGYFGLD